MVEQWKANRALPEGNTTDEAASEQSLDADGEKGEEYARLRQKYEALLEGAPDAIFVADAESGEIVEANQSAGALLETTVDQIIGRHQSELHPPEDADKYRSFFQAHQRAAASQGGATFSKLDDGTQICVVADTGEKIPVEINASFLDLDDEKLFVGIFRDITKRLRREEELRDAKEAAEEASELKAAMLRNMTHEIRTPITSIIGFSKILADSLDGSSQEHADKIHRASQRLMKTIDSVLDLSTMEANAHELERETARLCQAARWAVELLGAQAEENDLDLHVALPQEPIDGFWNQEALNQIAEHLLENAIKFTPAGGTVALRVWEAENEAILEVEDTGIGMKPKEVDTLFEPFEQASGGLEREYAGVGLGLAIVDELVSALGGTVEVETENGKGARFVVRFPFRESAGDKFTE